MGIPIIVVNQDGGALRAVCSSSEGTIGNPYVPIHAQRIPNVTCGNVTYHTLTHEANVGIHANTVTGRMIRIYVDSQSGATEESDTGDGSADNPFRCLSSAFRYLVATIGKNGHFINIRYVYPSEKLIGCCIFPQPSVQIVLTGVVDYEVPYKIEDITTLLITGDGDTEFCSTNGKTLLHISILGQSYVGIQNCKINISGTSSSFSDRKELLFDGCKIQCTGNGSVIEDGIWSQDICDFYSSETVLDGGTLNRYGGSNDFRFAYASKFRIRNSAKSLRFTAADGCPELLDADIDFLLIEYAAYRCTIQTGAQELDLRGVLKQCTLNIDTIYDSSYAWHRYMFETIHSSTITITFRNAGNVSIPPVSTGDVYDSSISYRVVITGSIQSGPYGYMYSPGEIMENSSFSGTVDLIGANQGGTDVYSFVYVLSGVADCAFKNVTISGALAIPSSISATDYVYQMCWVEDPDDDGFVHEGGHAFSRIAYASDPSMIEPCPMDPY